MQTLTRPGAGSGCQGAVVRDPRTARVSGARDTEGKSSSAWQSRQHQDGACFVGLEQRNLSLGVRRAEAGRLAISQERGSLLHPPPPLPCPSL